MKVLIACEESQRVCIAFRGRGHEAYSCDIQDCSGGHPEWHIKGDALEAIQGGTITTCDGVRHDIGKWDLLIAHPPCTYLSNAGACRLYPHKGQLDMERYRKGLAAEEFFLAFLDADIPRVAVENPVSSKIFDMPEHTQEIQPYQFGHPYTKKTRLWLRNLPPLTPTNVVEPVAPFSSVLSHPLRVAPRRTCSCPCVRCPTAHRAPGIAEAMAEQWGGGARKNE